GSDLPPFMRDWGARLAAVAIAPTPNAWTCLALDGGTPSSIPWAYEPRRSSDGKRTMFLSSLPGGEQTTGIIRSPAFSLPPKLSLFVAGHDGYPGTATPPAGSRNVVRLREVASGEVIAEAPVPRNDVAQRVTWELREQAGKQ